MRRCRTCSPPWLAAAARLVGAAELALRAQHMSAASSPTARDRDQGLADTIDQELLLVRGFAQGPERVVGVWDSNTAGEQPPSYSHALCPGAE